MCNLAYLLNIAKKSASRSLQEPYFTDVIVPGDMNKILCVRPKRSNLRIASQSGAFLIFGLDAVLPETGSREVKIERVAISAKAKKKICDELETLNIHHGTVYVQNRLADYSIGFHETGIREIVDACGVRAILEENENSYVTEDERSHFGGGGGPSGADTDAIDDLFDRNR